MKRGRTLLFLTLILSVASLFFEQAEIESKAIDLLSEYVDYAVLLLLIIESFLEYREAHFKRTYFKRNWLPLAFTVLFVVLFAYNKILTYAFVDSNIGSFPVAVVIIRNVFILLKIFNRLKKLSSFLQDMAAHPAQTIMLSFFFVILAGALLLMMPFTAAAGKGLKFIDALFTSTSAVCVTGLIVVDTATAFSVYGQLIILVLIQIGGLGIMILSYFVIFIMRRSVSIEDKMLIAYMLSEKDMSKLSRSLKNIIFITFSIEGIGAVLLFFGMRSAVGGSFAKTLFFAVFHSISAFCNAGFALFTDSLEGFRTNVPVALAVSLLIILGGISFAVITNVRQNLAGRLRNFLQRRSAPVSKLTMNSRLVLVMTGLLLLGGMLIAYGAEHRNTMSDYGLGEQYLAAFFQSVTLRTAGFNTIPFSGLRPVTYIVMAIFMFVGGASGSTAGGIKVNTVGILFAFLSASVRDKQSVTMFRHSVATNTVLKAFLILLFGISVAAVGTIFLLFTERNPVDQIIFEAISAFGTVGLSAGITGGLSLPGKAIIIILMFLGRLGPLTVLTAASLSSRRMKIEYPRGEIAIG